MIGEDDVQPCWRGKEKCLEIVKAVKQVGYGAEHDNETIFKEIFEPPFCLNKGLVRINQISYNNSLWG